MKPALPILASLTLLSSPVVAAEQATRQLEQASVYRAHVNTHPSQGEVRRVQGAEAMLLTTRQGAFASLATRDLTPGHVYTLWFVAINVPEACATSPCTGPDVLKRTTDTKADVGYGGGLVAGPDGAGRFVAHQPLGAIPRAWFGNGYTNAHGAEIHLVINDHGPLIAGREHNMLGTYRGGCTDKSLPAAFPQTAKADGEPGPNKCRLLQTAVFVQSKR